MVQLDGFFVKQEKRIKPKCDSKKFQKQYIPAVLLPDMGQFMKQDFFFNCLFVKRFLFYKQEIQKGKGKGIMGQQHISPFIFPYGRITAYQPENMNQLKNKAG